MTTEYNQRVCDGCVFLKIKEISLPRCLSAKEETCAEGEDPYAEGQCSKKIPIKSVSENEPQPASQK